MLGAEGLALLVVRHAGGVGARDRGAAGEGRCVVSAATVDLCGVHVAGVVGLHKTIRALPGRTMTAVTVRMYEPGVIVVETESEPARVLTEEAARAMVVEAWNETTGHGGGIYELHEAFTALLLRVAGPARPPCRVCDRPVGDHGPDPGNGTDFGIPGACDGYEPSDVDAGPVTADAVETCDSCHRTLGPDAEEQGEAGSAMLCGVCIREARAEGLPAVVEAKRYGNERRPWPGASKP